MEHLKLDSELARMICNVQKLFGNKKTAMLCTVEVTVKERLRIAIEIGYIQKNKIR